MQLKKIIKKQITHVVWNIWIWICMLVPTGMIAQEKQLSPALPSPQQVQWQKMEMAMFVHFAPNTWQGTELDDRSTPLQRINPGKLDVNQWIDAAESFGAKMIIFVAKHVGGFCMWQTSTTDYSIKSTPYKNGKGDVLNELADACQRRGMRLGVYIYPGDDTWGAYLGGGGRTKDPLRQEEYNQVLRKQWEEVLSRYGSRIHEIWFDGGLVVPLEDIVKKYAPHAIVFQGPFANIRWLGNEQGIAPYPAWNSVKAEDARTGVATAQHGDPDGEVWMPLEADVPLKDHNWFWSPTNHKNLRSLDQLMDIYYGSIGRGTLLLLNAAPDTTGLIPKEDMDLYRKFGEEIRHRFGTPVRATSGKGEVVELLLEKPTMVDHVIVQEDIVFGERVREYVLEGRVQGKWVELSHGTSVGYKRIEWFKAMEVDAVRFRSTKYSLPPVISNMSVYHTGKNPRVQVAGTSEMKIPGVAMDRRGQFTIDLSASILQAGQYELILRGKDEREIRIKTMELILQGVPTPGFVKVDPDGRGQINITAHPPGEIRSILVRGTADRASDRTNVNVYLRKRN